MIPWKVAQYTPTAHVILAMHEDEELAFADIGAAKDAVTLMRVRHKGRFRTRLISSFGFPLRCQIFIVRCTKVPVVLPKTRGRRAA